MLIICSKYAEIMTANISANRKNMPEETDMRQYKIYWQVACLLLLITMKIAAANNM